MDEMVTMMGDAIEKRLVQLRDDIAESISSHGLTASGATAKSLVVVRDSAAITLYGRAFFPALETGSSAWTGRTGVRCTFREFKEIIRNWASAKGLNFGQAREHERTIGAITMSIIRTGTKQTREPRLDVYTSLVDEAVEDCGNLCADILSARINDAINQWR